ncbi:rad55 protein [Ophiostoma piceae UAMH 11346]|uniref:Rad55 protein n=1 Tax=Ophiostoma piceae (strain UAMH 11346) TaxID=1262450 RepID=S3BM82_OPHP1|nr:rad55 protein [Ophiostoma piceae UAMH 11346]
MDYHSIHGHDVANFDTPLTHRVVTVSAADVLSQSSASSTTSETPALSSVPPPPRSSSRFISTSIETLDAILAGLPLPAAKEDGGPKQSRYVGGIRRAQVTEIWGPPGVGTSTLGMQLVANALRDGRTVAWLDCFQPLCEERLATIIEHQLRGMDPETDVGSVEDRFTRYTCPSLAHFIAMMCPPPPAQPACVPDDTSLLVIDSVSSLINYALPRTTDRKGAPLMANGRRGPTAYDKRTQVIQYVTAALERLAETRSIAIVVLTQCATRMQAERGAGLAPSLSADVWNRGIATRLVLFRDWAWNERESRPVGGRFVGIQKLNGHTSESGMDAIVPFDIMDEGLVEEHYTVISPRWARTIYKRKLDETDLESADTRRPKDDENYGWDEELANSLPQMPPQWQGSEDIMLGHRYDDEEEEEDEDENEEKEEEVENPIYTVDEDSTSIQRIPRRRSQSVADSEADSDV